MNIFSPSELANVQGWFLTPFTRYVLAGGMAQSIADRFNVANRSFTISHFNSFEKKYRGEDLNGKKIAIMRSNAFGDTLMVTGLVMYLKHRFPFCRIDIYTFPVVADLWPESETIHPYPHPLTMDAAMNYDCHFFLENLFEVNSEPDQRNAFDDMFLFAGFDPETVPVEFKRPHLFEKSTDWTELGLLKFFPAQAPYFVYQLSAANPNRTYPPDRGAETVMKMLEAFPDMKAVIVGKTKMPEEVAAFNASYNIGSDRVVNLINKTQSFRTLIPLVKNAKLVICPDSSIGHLAGAFPEVPVISLWGIFSPADRVTYYSNHYPVFLPDACPHAPCRNHEFTLPVALCKDAPGATEYQQTHCNAIRAITPDMIVAKATAILNPETRSAA